MAAHLGDVRSLLRLACVASFALAALATAVRGDVLARYAFDNGGASTDADAGSIAGDFEPVTSFTIYDYVGDPAPSYVAGMAGSTVGQSKTLDVYRSSTLAPLPGYELDLTTLTLDLSAYARTRSPFTAQVAVYTSLDAFRNPVYLNVATDNDHNDLAITPWSTITAPGMSLSPLYQGVRTPIEFRYYVFGNDDEGLAFIDNVLIEGTAVAIPEPASAASLGLAAWSWLARRRRR